MRQITKNRPPKDFQTHTQTPGAKYNNIPATTKDLLRESICNEQRGICCYCNGRIEDKPTAMKIEHFQSQKHFPKLQLEYANLLGACNGNEGHSGKLHCDTHKGDKALHFNPSIKHSPIETFIEYKNDGTITSSNSDLSNDINDILNLNLNHLKESRKNALDGFKDGLTKKKTSLTTAEIKKLLHAYEGSDSTSHLKPYTMIVVHYLRKRLKQSQ